MTDINMKQIRTGDIVRISGAYFKNDNGYYVVTNSPDDPGWCGADHSLTKVCKTGKISTARYNICFWPLKSFTNDTFKRAEANVWNAQHATIEVVHNISRDYAAEYFMELASAEDERYRWQAHNWGENHMETIRIRLVKEFHEAVAEYCKNHDNFSEKA